MPILTDFMYICHMNPFVSIIIPFYGEADPALLQRALDSIRGQGMAQEEYEIIVTDDTSRTTGGARNNGMRQARGKYLLFVDADDILLPGALPPCLTLLRQYSPDILRFGFRRLRRGSAPASASTGNAASHSPLPSDHVAPPSPSRPPHVPPPPFTRYGSGAHYMQSTNFLGVAWAHLFRRDMLEKANLTFSEASLYEDEEFVAKAYYHAQSMLVTPFRVYGYSWPPASSSRPRTLDARRRKMDAFCYVLINLSDFVENNPWHTLQSYALHRRISFLAIDCIRLMLRNRCRIGEMHRRMALLWQVGALPLPVKWYGWKYLLALPAVNLYVRLFLPRCNPYFLWCDEDLEGLADEPYSNDFDWS